MNRETQSIVVGLLGGLLLSITVSGRYTSYVKPGFAPYLLVAGTILVLVGILSLVLGMRSEARARRVTQAAGVGAGTIPGESTPDGDLATGPPEAHGHDHDSSRAPWLILVPVLVLLLVAPPALGADAVARNATSQAVAGAPPPAADPAPVNDGGIEGGGYKFNDGSGSVTDPAGSVRTMQFPPLPAGPDPAVSFRDFVLRALYDADRSVDGTPVTLTGFLAPPGEGFASGFTIARLTISCCAADANPMQVHVAGEPPFPPDTWVSAVVSAVPDTGTLDNGYVPIVTVSSITPVSQPADPYEH